MGAFEQTQILLPSQMESRPSRRLGQSHDAAHAPPGRRMPGPIHVAHADKGRGRHPRIIRHTQMSCKATTTNNSTAAQNMMTNMARKTSCMGSRAARSSSSVT